MGTPKNLSAYGAEQEIMLRALENEAGCKISLSTYGKAINFRQRLFALRVLDRARNKEVYPVGEALHGKSPYDRISISSPKEEPNGEWTLILTPSNVVKITDL